MALVVAVTALACGDGRGASSSTALVIDPGTSLATSHPGPAAGPRDPAPYNRRPILAPLAWSAVGVGQSISFGIDVVDPESDPIEISLTTHPASASWSPGLLTVEWTPSPADGPVASFEVTVVETLDPAGTRRATIHPFRVAVVDIPQPAPAVPAAEVADAELLLTFTGARVVAAAARAPLAALVTRGFGITAAELLSRLARVHGNRTLDPSAPEFDRRFELDRWQLVAVRLRPGPMLPGASFVYRVPGIAAWIRIRFGARSANAVAQLARDWLMEGNLSGGPRPEHRDDLEAHAAAVAGMVSFILDTRRSGFEALALDHAGRLGGGIERDASGAYASGDGWAFWRLGGLPPVVTSLEPGPEGDRYAPRCAPRYDPESPDSEAAALVLCNAHGLVAVESETESGRALDVETTGASRSFRRTHAVADVGEADLRRIPFGEHGMSCIACHTRTFDWGGAMARRPAVSDPSDGATVSRARAAEGVFFTFLRPGGPRAGLSALEAYELCELRDSLERIGYDPRFECPLGSAPPVRRDVGP